jgi:hypothetical protein
VEYVARFGKQDLHVVRFAPPESECYQPGSDVLVELPTEGLQLLPAD